MFRISSWRKADARRLIAVPVLGLALVLVGGCATVPRESVQLSYVIGQDLLTLQQSHDLLISRYFEALRADVNNAIDQVFVPAYIGDFVESGKLMEHAAANRADLVELWARIAVRTIDEERQKRLQPLDEAERGLRSAVDDAFARALRANAAVTAHLNSIREVSEAQDEFLEALDIKDIRDRIGDGLVQASETAARARKDIEDAAAAFKGNGH